MRSLIRGSFVPASAAIWDQSSCIALVLPDACFHGLRTTRGGRRRADTRPGTVPARVGHRPGRTAVCGSWPGGGRTAAPLPVFGCRRRVPVGLAHGPVWSAYVVVDARRRASRPAGRGRGRTSRRGCRGAAAGPVRGALTGGAGAGPSDGG